MKDFNFFEPYLKKEKFSRNRRLFIMVAAILISFSAVALFVKNNFKVKTLKDEIAIMENMLNSKNSQEITNGKNIDQEIYNIMDNYYKILSGLEEHIYKTDVIGNDLIEKVSSATPKNISYSSMNISGQAIQMQVTADSRVTAAELEHNLKGLGIFKKVYIPSLSLSEIEGGKQRVNFSITCTLRDVYKNGD